MHNLTKKRTKAYFIDMAISTVVTVSLDSFLSKRIKNDTIHTWVTPSVIMWSLEYVQMKSRKQTIGYKLMGLSLENQSDSETSTEQLLKRMVYRDLISFFLIKSKNFEREKGAVLPHDHYALTRVKETEG